MLDRIVRNTLFILLVMLLYTIVFSSTLASSIESILPEFIKIYTSNSALTEGFTKQLLIITALIVFIKTFILVCFFIKNEVLNFLTFLVFSTIIYLSNTLSSNFNIILPFIPSVLLLIIFYLFFIVYKTSYISKERQYVKKLFARYVNPDLLDNLVNNPNLFKVVGQHKELTVMFSDIRGFTKLSEKLPSEDTFHVLNSYLNRMTKVLKKYHATIDKYIGDAIMAFWNAPLDDTNKELHAVYAALDMVSELKNFNKEENHAEFSIGIGINTGKMLVGNVGSFIRLDYTVIGDEVNLASRIEGLTKKYGVEILISHSTYLKVKTQNDLLFREIDEVIVKGKKNPVKIYQPFKYSNESKNITAIYNKAYQLYRGYSFKEADKYFSMLPYDTPSKILKDRMLKYHDVLKAKDGIWAWDEK